MRRKILTTIVGIAFVLSGLFAVHQVTASPKPANAWRQCAWYDYYCNLMYQRCGPYVYNPWTGLFMDRCGNIQY